VPEEGSLEALDAHDPTAPRATGTYDLVAGLPLTIESYALERRELTVTSGFTRVTTVIRLRGRGEEGIGEDVTYSAEDGTAFQRKLGDGALALAGSWASLDDFSRRLDELDLFTGRPDQDAYRDYRRWGFESAALDLALRQAGRSLADVLEREPAPVTFVVSLRLPEPPTIEPLLSWLEDYPELRFKLDATVSWDDALVAELAERVHVESVDLKGAYRGTVVDNPADPLLYRLVAEGFPQAWIEDPNLDDPAADAALAAHRERITWDAPIHSVADIEGLPFPPRRLNIKPSRFGSLERLFAAYDFCDARGIGLYGGGQFELGPGRGHIQYLASLFHPGAPNDVAPGGYNSGPPRPGLPRTPLTPQPSSTGFRWGETDPAL